MHLESIEVAGKERFVFRQTYEEFQRDPVAKRAGFTFNYNGIGRENRYWYTDDIEIAARLRNFAAGELRERLTRITAKPKNKPTLSFEDASGRYVFRSEKQHKDIPKEAGFFWSQDDKAWWTFEPDRAAKLAEYADDTCRSALQSAIAEMERARELSRAVDADIDIPLPPGLALYGYQRAGVAAAVRQLQKVRSKGKPPGVLISDQMGLGKSIEAIAILNWFAVNGGYGKTMILAPASLKVNWQREVSKWLIDARSRKILIGDTKTSKWKFEAADIVILNYDALSRLMEFEKEKRSIRVKGFGALDFDWDCLIVDEAHLIKSSRAQRSALSEAIAKRANKVVYMTGTPIVNRPAELFTLIHTLDPDTWPSFYKFSIAYCEGGNNGYGFDSSGANRKRLSELQDKLRGSGLMIRRLKKDVLTELPPKQRQVIEVPVADLQTGSVIRREQEAWLASRAMIEGLKIAVELAKASDDPRDYERAVQQLKEGVAVSFEEISKLRHETALAKVPYTIAHIKSLIEDDPLYKCVVFAWHNDVIQSLSEAFAGKVVVVTGATSAKTKVVDGQETSERMQMVDRFQTDPNIQVFIGNIKAAGVGLTLTASSHVIFHELDYVPGNISQAEDRTHRVGQRDSVLVQHLVLEGSLDVNMAQVLIEKQQIIDKALDAHYRPQDGIAESLERERIEMPDEDPIVPFTASEEAASKSITKERIAKAAALLSDEQIKAVHLGLRMLSGMCDGAQSLDGAGFNRMDSGIGKSLAAQSALSAKQAVLGQKMCIRYGRQLPAELLAVIKGEKE